MTAAGRTQTVAALLNRIADADGTGWVEPGGVRNWLTMPATRPENFRLLEADGDPLAYVDLYVVPGVLDRRSPALRARGHARREPDRHLGARARLTSGRVEAAGQVP